VRSLLETTNPFAVETSMSAALLQTASDLLQPPVPESLARPYYKLKCEELLCHTLALLLQREATAPRNVHARDLQALYAVKRRLHSFTESAPSIAALARQASMSAPTLRHLFKQTFGQTVFAYYQTQRMHEAARLLREQHLSVAEVGYQVGFTNLSHFARVFKRYQGLTPKRYAASPAT
jgi:AraC-like DNA-binding protein